MSDQSSQKLHRWVAVLCGMLVVGGGGFYVWNKVIHYDPYFSSPKVARPWAVAEFDATMHPVASSGSPLDAGYMGTFKILSKKDVSTDPDRFSWELDVEKTPPLKDFLPKYEVIELDAVRGAEGKFVVQWLAARTNDSQYHENGHLKLSLFHADGSPMKESEMAALHTEPYDVAVWKQLGEASTEFQVCGELTGYDDIKWQCPQFFDAATRVKVSTGGSYRPVGGKLSMRSPNSIIHAAPLIGVFDFTHGPAETFAGNFVEGQVLSGSGVQLQILAICEGAPNSYSFSSQSSLIRLGASGPKDSQGCVCVISVMPYVMEPAITLEAIDREGKAHNVSGGGMGGVKEGYTMAAFDIPASQIESLRIKYRPHFTRLLVRHDKLLGVPSANVAPVNLFDVVVPEVTFQSESHMQSCVGNLTELQVPSTTGTSAKVFPMTMKNTTPRQVLERCQMLNPNLQVEIDQKAQTIHYRTGASKWEQVKAWLKARFPIP